MITAVRPSFLLILLAAATVTAAPLTIDDYVTMPTLSAPRISPDGQRVSYVVTTAAMKRSTYESNVWVVGTDGSRNVQLTRSGGTDEVPRWSPDGKWIAFLSERDGATAIYLISPDGGEAAKLSEEKIAIRTFEWSPDGKSIAFLRSDERSADDERRVAQKDDARVVGGARQHVHLHVIDVASRTSRRVTSGPFSIFAFSWSPDSLQLAFDRAAGQGLDDMYRTDIYIVAAKGGEPRPVVVRSGVDRSPVFSPNGKLIAFVSGGGVYDWLREQRLSIVTLATGAVRTVADAYERTAEKIVWSEDSSRIVFEGPLNTTTQIFRVNSDGSGFENVSEHEGLVTSIDVDTKRERVAFVLQSLTSPPEIAISDLRRFAPRVLTSHNAAYHTRTLAETKIIRWKNLKDGLEIEGLLTLPIGYNAGQKYPMLTFVHGGPASRFDQGFLGYLGYIYPPHVFAARGFAVFRPNPRGTGGYGERFRMANRRDWGGMDWVDINAGIDMLIAQGIADPDKLGLMGWSYGGFMASWALGHSDRLKAVSVGAPVVDLLSFHGTTDIRSFIPAYFQPDRAAATDLPVFAEMKTTPLSLDLIRERSPLWNLKPTKAVVLIQHGEADDRVPLSQGTMLYRVLSELGVDVTFVTYPRTPHTPREPKLRVDVATRNVELFTKVLLN